MKRARVCDGVIGGQDQHDGVGVGVAKVLRRGRDGRSRVPRHRLENLRRRDDAELLQLLRNHEAMLVVAHQDRRGAFRQRGDARRGVLQQAARGDERQDRLRPRLARQRPQARAAAAAQNHRVNPLCHALFYGPCQR